MRMICLVFLVVSACTHVPPKAPEGDGLYPYGAYQHNVKIQVLQPESRTMEMRGAVSVDAQKVRVIGLSTFGTTVFRIEEDRHSGVIKKEFYLEIMQKNSERFLEFYALIRELLTAPKGVTTFTRRDAQFAVSAPDEKGIYRHVHIVHPQVVLDIEVLGYEF